MRRQRPLGAEVLRRRHDAAAEEHLPVAIHRHARRQRMVRVGQPARQAEPVARRVLRERRQRRRRVAADGPVLRGVVVAAGEDIRLSRLRHLLHRHDLEDARLGREQPLACLPQLGARLRRFRVDRREVIRPQRRLVLAAEGVGQRLAVVELGRPRSSVSARSKMRSSSSSPPLRPVERKRSPKVSVPPPASMFLVSLSRTTSDLGRLAVEEDAQSRRPCRTRRSSPRRGPTPSPAAAPACGRRWRCPARSGPGRRAAGLRRTTIRCRESRCRCRPRGGRRCPASSRPASTARRRR